MNASVAVPAGRNARSLSVRQVSILAIFWLQIAIATFWTVLPFPTVFFIALLILGVLHVVKFARYKIPLGMLALPAVALVYLFFSYLHLLPSGWTIVYDRSAILQHATGYFLFPIMVMVNALLFRDCPQLRRVSWLWFGAVAVLATMAPLITYLFKPRPEYLEDDLGFAVFRLGTLINGDGMLMLLLGIVILSVVGWKSRLGLAAIFILWAQALQAMLLGLVLLVLAFAWGKRTRRLYCVSIFAVLALSTILTAIFKETVFMWDANTGIRGFFWSDATELLLETFGIGVGFGTEALRGQFAVPDGGIVTIGTISDGLLFIGVHNAFVQSAIRMGLIGLVAFVITIRFLYPRDPDRKECFVWTALVLTLFSNVAITSFNLLLATSMLGGYLYYSNWLRLPQQVRYSDNRPHAGNSAS